MLSFTLKPVGHAALGKKEMMVAPRLLRRAALVLCLGLCDSQGRTKPPTAAPTGTNAPSQEPTAKPTWAMDAVRNDRVPHVSPNNHVT